MVHYKLDICQSETYGMVAEAVFKTHASLTIWELAAAVASIQADLFHFIFEALVQSRNKSTVSC